MYLAELAEVAIGLVVVYFLVSMASSQILEWISQGLKWRSRDLETAIRGMILNQPVEPRMFGGLIQLLKGKIPEKAEEEIIKRLYEHPLIQPLSGKSSFLGKTIKPTNIPARTFALALFDTVMSAGTGASTIQQALRTVNDQIQNLPDLANKPEVQKALNALIEQAKQVGHNDSGALQTLKQALDHFAQQNPQFKPVLDALLQVDPVNADAAFRQFGQALTSMAVNNPQLKRTLGSLISQAALEVKEGENKIAAARTNVEAWFNGTMDQLSDLYKRRAKLWSGVIALVLAVILNVDTLVIANTLWREPTLRQAIVANVEKLQPPPTPAPSTATTISVTQPISPTVTVNELKKQLEELQLPVGGWQVQPRALKPDQMCVLVPGTAHVWGIWWNGACKGLFLQDLKPGLSGALAKLVGWLITAAAAAQGAPFWFDLLNKLLQLRGGEKKPEEKAATT